MKPGRAGSSSPFLGALPCYDGKNNFLDETRRVNNALAVGSFYTNNYKYKSGGVPSMRIYGETFRYINKDLLPKEEG